MHQRRCVVLEEAEAASVQKAKRLNMSTRPLQQAQTVLTPLLALPPLPGRPDRIGPSLSCALSAFGVLLIGRKKTVYPTSIFEGVPNSSPHTTYGSPLEGKETKSWFTLGLISGHFSHYLGSASAATAGVEDSSLGTSAWHRMFAHRWCSTVILHMAHHGSTPENSRGP